MIIKTAGKALLCRILEAQVRRLRRRNQFTIVAVAGSVGKTSTKLAIASLLSSNSRVMYQDGNYNDRLTVPLVLFGQAEPGIYNVWSWLKILLANQRVLSQPYPYDMAVLELGTDGPGQLAKFAYLKPEIVVITAVAPEHMEFFGDLDAVAKEELAPLNYSKEALLNVDDIPARFITSSPAYSYGQDSNARYRLTATKSHNLAGQTLDMTLGGTGAIKVETSLIGQPGAKIVLAAAAVADMLQWPVERIQAAITEIKPVTGRMRVLAGAAGSTLIDDTYNSSPSAALSALDVLFQAPAKQRIAILGSMNELGRQGPAAHRQVGAYCQADKLDLLVTIGADAEKYLAPVAGCEVKSFASPYEAGEFVSKRLKPDTVVLAKGSEQGLCRRSSQTVT